MSAATKFEQAVGACPHATPGRYALLVSPELFVEYDGEMMRRSGGTVAKPLMYGSYNIYSNADVPIGSAVLMLRSEIRKLERPT